MKQPHTYKISFCIICMNRLGQLQETLLKNLADNAGYPDLEFILLDYNSQDGMVKWAKDHLQKYVDDGRMVYYRTNEPQEFNHSHAKNLAFKLATGDILCNINADHFTGEGFAAWVNQQFVNDEHIILTPVRALASEKAVAPKDVFGKVCIRKEHFSAIGGYDERMLTYGFEDFDLINRAEMLGVERRILADHRFLKFISHTDDRSAIGNNYERPERIYVRHINFYSSDILLLFASGLAETGIMVDESLKYADDPLSAIAYPPYRFEYTLTDSAWQTGRWSANGPGQLAIIIANEEITIRSSEDRRSDVVANSDTLPYFLLEDNRSIKELMDFYYLFKNRGLLENNLRTRNVRPNNYGYGKAVVFKNFDDHTPITVN